MEKRIFGATDGIREKVGESVLVPNRMHALGIAIAKFFDFGKLAIGRDTRESGVWMNKELIRGIEEAGGTVVDLGVVPTPAVAKIITERDDLDGGIMITASHNPASDNGIKVFRADGVKLVDEEELQIEEAYFAQELEGDIEIPEVEISLNCDAEAVDDYIHYVSQALGIHDLRGLKVTLDAASGAGHEFSQKVFKEFGLWVDTIDAEPNGQNINEECGALYPERVADIAKWNESLGVALDGDADRVMLSDEEGRVWDGDRIVAMFADYLHEKGELKGDAIVVSEYSNLAMINYLAERGIEVRKVVNGDRLVAQKCIADGLTLGAEFSGHILYMPWLTSSDGTFAALFALKIMKEKDCKLADLWPAYELAPSKQWAIKVTEKKPLEELPDWNEAVAAAEERFAGNGRVFARYSGTENKLRILVEAADMATVEEVGEQLAEIVKKEIGND